MSDFTNFVEMWQNCTLCSLHCTRTKIVLARGVVPCDALFVGEAPGVSEDMVGRPFVGPAGKLLDQMIEDACTHADYHPSKAYTNLVCCLPLDEATQRKWTEPPVESIEACTGRLLHFATLCKPKLVVCVGALAEKWVPHLMFDQTFDCDVIGITHPAAILRADISQQSLAIHRVVVTLSDAFDRLNQRRARDAKAVKAVQRSRRRRGG